MHAYLVFTLQKFFKKPPLDTEADLKIELKFDAATGTVKEEVKHLLNYDRPNYKIYPVHRNGKYLTAEECAFCG